MPETEAVVPEREARWIIQHFPFVSLNLYLSWAGLLLGERCNIQSLASAGGDFEEKKLTKIYEVIYLWFLIKPGSNVLSQGEALGKTNMCQQQKVLVENHLLPNEASFGSNLKHLYEAGSYLWCSLKLWLLRGLLRALWDDNSIKWVKWASSLPFYRRIEWCSKWKCLICGHTAR